jgi:AraC-like DNA-binding protein
MNIPRHLFSEATGQALGFNEVSAFTHAFKRWTGKTPREMRSAAHD